MSSRSTKLIYLQDSQKKVHNIVWKSKVSKNQNKYTIVQREKELYNIKYYYTSFESLGTVSLNQVY